MLSQHSAESLICCLCVRRIAVVTGLSLVFVVRDVGFIARRICCGLYPISLKNSGEENQFLGEGILVTESLGSVYKGRED